MHPEPNDLKSGEGGDTTRISVAGELKEKQVVGGRYEVLSCLGKGGMGLVYRVKQIFLNKEFALKTIDKNCMSEIAIQRFQQEARTASSLEHPSIIAVNDFGVLDDQTPFLVMELVNGETLGERLKRTGCLTLEQAIQVFTQVCFALAYAHECGIVHRDVKPNNIMLLKGMPLGAEGSVKILDFGIAKSLALDGSELQALTSTGEIFGSPLYMSPEQCTGYKVDHRADIYSLGCVLFEALTGTPPFLGDNAFLTMMKHKGESPPTLKEASLGGDFPQALEDMVATMLAKSPEKRYQNLSAVAHDLGALRRGASVSSTAKSSGGEAQAMATTTSMPKHKLIIGTALLSAAVAGVLGYQLHIFQSARPLPTDQAESKKESVQLSESEQLAKLEFDPVSHVIDNQEETADSDKEAFSRAAPIRSSIVTKHGVQERQFVFPDRKLGRLSNLPVDGRTSWGKRSPYYWWDAKGTVSTPIDIPLTLEVGGPSHLTSGVFEIPAIFEKIDRKEFCGLKVMGNKLITPADSVAQILETVAGWANIQSLVLERVPVNKAAMNALNKMKHLRKLELMFSDSTSAVDLSRQSASAADRAQQSASAAELARQPFLERLEYLRLSQVPVNEILRGLAGSSNLKYLVLEKSSIDPDALQRLQRCPNLEHLFIFNDTIDDPLIKAVTQIRSLRQFFVKSAQLTPRQTRLVRQLPAIKFENYKRD